MCHPDGAQPSAAAHSYIRSKAVGPDGVCLSVLRECFAVIGPHLLHVINHSLASGCVPAVWKLATVVPLHKGGVLTEPSNFRPISVLSVVGKLAEKVVCTPVPEKWFRDLNSQNKLSRQRQNKIFRCVQKYSPFANHGKIMQYL